MKKTYISGEKTEGVFTKNVSGFLIVYAYPKILGATTKATVTAKAMRTSNETNPISK